MPAGFAPVLPADLPGLRDLATAIWREAYRDLLGPAQIAYMLELMYAEAVVRAELAAGVRWEFIERDGVRAGFISWRHEGDGWTKLNKIYLRAEHRGTGLAGTAVARVVAAACAHGGRGVFLTVNVGNLRAQRAYAKLGFRIAESVVADIGGGFVMDDHVMRLDWEARPS